MGYFNDLLDVLYTRNVDGSHEYMINQQGDWNSIKDNLAIAQKHPILTPAILFVSNLFAQGRFKVVDRRTKKEKINHWLIKLLNKPNEYQTRIDFLETLNFVKIARGSAIIYLRQGISSDNKQIDAMYVLDPKLITYPQDFNTKHAFRSDYKEVGNTIVIYDKGGENLTIALKNLLFLYDLPNSITRNQGGKTNMFLAKSRLDGMRQTLINTMDSMVAKNIILKSNGKEMLSGAPGEGYSLKPEEKADAEGIFNNGYGLALGRKRAFITKANVLWKSMHIALRDLGLDESTKVDGNIVYTALQIPKDILSLEAKKTTYNNFKESMTSYIQNGIQSIMNDVTETFNVSVLEETEELIGTYDHMPIMQYILKEKWEAVSSRAKALNDLLKTGVPEKEALELTEFPATMTLDERQDIEGPAETAGSNTQASAGNDEEEDDEAA